MKDKVATFHILARNHVCTYMSLGTTNHCHFTWVQGIPVIADESRSIGAFYAHPQKYKKRGWCGIMRKRTEEHRQEWLKQEVKHERK